MLTIRHMILSKEEGSMKKILFVALILCFVLSVPIAAFAEAMFNESGTTATINHSPSVLSEYKTSKNVEVYVTSAQQSYAATADHLNGNRVFGAASGDSVIKWAAKQKGQHADDAGLNPGSTSDSSAFSGWSQL